MGIDDVVWWHRYCGHFVIMYVVYMCVGMLAQYEEKPLITMT